MKKLLCTLFAAAVVAAMSAVTAFAEDNLIFIKTAPTPKDVTEYAEKTFAEHPHMADILDTIGLTEEQQKTAQLGSPIVIKRIYDADYDISYNFPIICNGKFAAFMHFSDTSGNSSAGQAEYEDKLNKLVTSPDMPAEIYSEGDKFGTTFAAVGDEVIVLRNMFDEDKSEQIEAIKKLREEENLDEEYVINVYGYSKTGWITVDGSKYFIRKNGTLATGNLTIGEKRYSFDENGKYLGTFTGFVRSGGKRCYYKDGVKQTGDFTVNGKFYHADKNGIIEDKKIYIKTQDIPEDIINYAKNVFKESESILIGVGLTEAQAKSAVIHGGFVIKNADEPNETEHPYQFPILCNGRAVARLTVFPLENGEYTFSISKSSIMEKLNDLTTAPTAPAEIYFSSEFVFAVTNDEFTLLDAPNGYKKDKMEKAIEKIKTYRSNVKFKNDIVTAI